METMLRKIQLNGYRLWVTGLIALLPVLCQAMPVNAVNYKNTYNIQSTMYHVQSTVSGQSSAVSSQTAMPSAGFQSTSVYAGQWSGTDNAPMLNADGTVNAEAYGVGANRPGMRKNSSVNPGTPDDDEEEEGEQQPIGDGLLPLLLCALGYLYVRNRRTHPIRLGRSETYST